MDKKKQLNGINFKLRAAEFYLSDNVEEGLEFIEKAVESNKGIFPYGGVNFSIWEPFENYPMSNILIYIEDLALKFKEIYNEGKADNITQVSNTCCKK